MKDLEIETILTNESKRQKETINLIASENLISEDIKMALASDFSNKYAEGYPGARYYAGNQFADELETLTQKRALELFGLNAQYWSVNVQALSGSPANLAAYAALVPLGGKIMGLALDHGGHLTHGFKVSLTGKIWKGINYQLDRESELLDYEKIRELALQERPDIIVAGFTAYSREINWHKFRAIADEVGSFLHADISHTAGLIASGFLASPFLYADTVMTTTHKTLRGPRGALIFTKKDGRNLEQKIDKAVFPTLQGGPHLNNIAGIAVALHEAQSNEFKKYIEQVIQNTQTLCETLQGLGWRIISGGTDSHLFLVDTWKEGIDGKQASERLEKAGIIVNKNTIPYDGRPSNSPSGIRLGAAFETSKGKNQKEMIEIAHLIDQILKQDD